MLVEELISLCEEEQQQGHDYSDQIPLMQNLQSILTDWSQVRIISDQSSQLKDCFLSCHHSLTTRGLLRRWKYCFYRRKCWYISYRKKSYLATKNISSVKLEISIVNDLQLTIPSPWLAIQQVHIEHTYLLNSTFMDANAKPSNILDFANSHNQDFVRTFDSWFSAGT